MKVECVFCHEHIPEDEAWQSQVKPGNWWCNDESECVHRWSEWAKNALEPS